MDVFQPCYTRTMRMCRSFSKRLIYEKQGNRAGHCEQLFKELYTELTLHAEVEEDIVYPFFEEKQETREIVEESLQEHEEIETLLSELKVMPPDDEEWMST